MAQGYTYFGLIILLASVNVRASETEAHKRSLLRLGVAAGAALGCFGIQRLKNYLDNRNDAFELKMGSEVMDSFYQESAIPPNIAETIY